jgi:hypothetical protein
LPRSPIRFAGRNAAVGQHDVAGVRLARHRLVARLDAEAGPVTLDEERGGLAHGRSLLVEQMITARVAERRAGDEALGAVEDELVPFAHRARLQGTGIGAGFRLGDREADRLLRPGHGQDEAFHLVGRDHLGQRAHPRRAGQFAQHVRRERRTAGVDRLLDQHVVDQAEARAAQRLGQRHAIEAQFAGALPDLIQQRPPGPVLVRDAVLGGQRVQLLAEEGVQPCDELARGFGAFEGGAGGALRGGGCVHAMLLS